MGADFDVAVDVHAADFDVAKLFHDAKELSKAAVDKITEDHDLMVRDLVGRTERQVASLFKEIVVSLEDAVPAAARMGHRQLTLLHFKGSGTYVAQKPADASDDSAPDDSGNPAGPDEGMCLLYLLLGPRDTAMQRYLAPYNVTFLLERLRTHLFPFAVRHTWHQHDHSNSVVLHW